MQRLRDKAGILLIGFFLTSSAFAHARWKLGSTVTPPRTNATGLKTGPCGGAARTTTPRAFMPGQTITVEWEETINHPGYYRVAFSEKDDAGFDNNILAPMVVDNQDTPVVAGQEHQFTTTVTLPTTLCTGCTLQLIQYMTENPQTPSLYYSCSDIQITADGKPVPVPTTPNTPTDTPTAVPTKPTGLKLQFK